MSDYIQTALITGAGNGIGRATAIALAKSGRKVSCADIKMDDAQRTADAIMQHGVTAHAVIADVGSISEIEAMIKETLSVCGSLDIIVNNAGVTRAAYIMDLTEEDWDRIHRVNAKGVFFCLQVLNSHWFHVDDHNFGLIIDPLPIWLRLLDGIFFIDFFPLNGTDSLWWIMIIHTSIVDALRAMGFVLVISMIYDIVEDSQINTGRRDEGVFMSGPNLIQKILSGFGIFLLGIVMQLFGFDNTNMSQTEIAQPIRELVIFQSIIGPILSLAGIFCLLLYNITREKFHRAIDHLGFRDN